MKATGIVRRIDELGRVVIPKEIRRTQHIRQGTPLEIFTTGDGEVIFKKYSPVEELEPLAQRYVQVLSRSLGVPCLICDREQVIAACGAGKKELEGKPISPRLEQTLEKRNLYKWSGGEEPPLAPCQGSSRQVGAAAPILAAGELVGAVAALTQDPRQPCPPEQAKAVQVAAGFLARQMEE